MTTYNRRPRALTLALPNSKQPYLVFGGRKFTLRNFSQEGIGLWMPPPPPFSLAVGSQISGDIVVSNDIFSVQLDLVHFSKSVIGLRITQADPALNKLFHELLEPSTYAATLVPQVSDTPADPVMGGKRLWYKGEGESELIVWYNEFSRMILAIQLSWLGKWVFRKQFELPMTGHIHDELTSPLLGRRLQPEELLECHAKPDPVILQQAAQFLTSVPVPTPGHLFWQFLELGEQVFLPSESLKNAVGGNK